MVWPFCACSTSLAASFTVSPSTSFSTWITGPLWKPTCTPSLVSPTAGSALMEACIFAAACTAASGVGKRTITSSPMVFTTWPPVDSAAVRSRSMQRAMAFSATASPAVSISRVLPLTSAKRTVASLMFGLPVYKVSKSRPVGNDKVGEALRVAHRAPFCRCATTARMRKNRGLSLFLRAMQKKRKVALVTGITGQDGAYLAELLLGKGYIVHGIKRRASLFNTDRIDHLYQDPHVGDRRFILHHGDMTDSSSLTRVIQQAQPDELYNLAAQSHVAVPFEEPEDTADSDGIGTLRLLEALRILGLEKKTRFYQAATSELFGLVRESPQTEKTPFYPRSPYGAAKLYAYWITVNYREAYGLFACNGILFNHESPVRGETFVSRKITRAFARISLGLQDCLYLGNLEARRDWGHAREYVEAQWLMLQQDKPEDLVIATGEQHSVREFVVAAAKELGMQVSWKGKGADERGFDQKGRCVVAVDPRHFRPTEVDSLMGDASRARQ